jgi:hypothetical protein
MAVAQAGMIIMPALVVGAIIGLIEMIFVHSDEIAMGWFYHGLHALPFTMAFVWVNMNVNFAYSFLHLPFAENFWIDLGIKAAISIIAMLKIQTAAAIAGRVGERFYHTLIIGALILGVGLFSKVIVSAITFILPAALRF